MIKLIVACLIGISLTSVFVKLLSTWVDKNSHNKWEYAENICFAMLLCLLLEVMTLMITVAFVDLFWRW